MVLLHFGLVGFDLDLYYLQIAWLIGTAGEYICKFTKEKLMLNILKYLNCIFTTCYYH